MSTSSARRAPRVVITVVMAVLAVLGLLPGDAQAANGAQVFNVGTAPFLGDMRSVALNAPIVDFAPTPSGNGYYEVASDGGIFAFGDAQFMGSTGSIKLNQPIVAMASYSGGYYLMAKDGGVFTFGATPFYGSGVATGKQFSDFAASPIGGGYWELATDGSVWSYGDGASAVASQPPASGLASGVTAVALATNPAGTGLWVVYSDGRVDHYGTAADFGNGPSGISVVDATAAPDGTGLWLVGATGRVDALGALTRSDDVAPDRPVSAIAAQSTDGYWIAAQGGNDPGVIAGRVLDDLGTPAANACLFLDNSFFPSATTPADGTFRISATAGSHTLKIGSCPGDDRWAVEYYKDVPFGFQATPIAVSAGQDTSLGDVVIDRAAAITGVVRGPDGAPAPNLCAGTSTGVNVRTTVTGYYRLGGLPSGQYAVSFGDCGAGELLGEYYDDARTIQQATPVSVTSGETRSGVDAQLSKAGAISGVVTTSDGGALGSACVVAVGENGSFRSVPISTTGYYRVPGLVDGGYKLHFNDCNGNPFGPVFPSLRNDYVDEWWNDQPTEAVANPVTVVANGPDVTGVNAELLRGGTISGTVTRTNGQPVGGGECVDAVQGSTSIRTFTTVTGFYAIKGLRPGSYGVRFAPCSVVNDVVTEWWPNSPGQSGSTPVTVGSGETRANIDAVLEPAGLLDGRVTDEQGNPVLACIDVFDDALQLSAGTRANFNGITGNYRIGGLNTASYYLRFRDCRPNSPDGFANEWFQDAATKTDAAPVGAVQGQTLTVPTAVLGPDSGISGVVRSDDGALLSGICVRAFDANGLDVLQNQLSVSTTITGFYRIPRLSPSSYKVLFDSRCTPGTYSSEWWRDASSMGAATAVTTTAGATTPNVDAVLSIAGRPQAPTGVAATAGVESATVSWNGVGDGRGAITGYRITASPGGAVRSVGATARSVVFDGLAAGQAYQFTVQATNVYGTGVGATSAAVTPSGASSGGSGNPSPGPNPTPTEPAPTATLPTQPSSPTSTTVTAGDSQPVASTPGGEVAFSGTGFGPNQPGDVIINSTPRKLGSFVTDATGSFSVAVTIPADMELGNHTLVATAKGPDGQVRALSSPLVVASPNAAKGYRMVASDGGLFAFGDAPFQGSAGGSRLSAPIVAGAATPTNAGYWLVGADGVVLTFGDANFYGSLAGTKLNKPIVGMAATPTGKGYWLVATDGGMFAFGDATFLGSTGDLRLNQPIVGMTTTPSGKGYWLVASDGGIFAFGDAAFFGSTGAMKLNKPIVGMASSPTGQGYWLVASDGGIFSFGDAGFFGSTGDMRLNQPIVAMSASPLGRGYRLVASDGGVFTFGDAAFFGSTGDLKLVKPILAVI